MGKSIVNHYYDIKCLYFIFTVMVNLNYSAILNKIIPASDDHLLLVPNKRILKDILLHIICFLGIRPETLNSL